MEFEYKKATIDNLNILTKTRIEVLRAANDLHTAYLVFDGDNFWGSGGISYYTVMPTFHNPTGRKLYERYGFISMSSEIELPIK